MTRKHRKNRPAKKAPEGIIATIIVEARKPRGKKRIRRIVFAALLLVSVKANVEVRLTEPIVVGPVTIEPTFSIGLPLLGE